MIRRPLRNALYAMLGVVALGTLGLVTVEGWRPLDAFWMVVITLTTIGYGEVHPLSDGGRVLVLGIIVAGLSVATWATSQLTQAALEGDVARWITTRRQRTVMKHLHGHTIVAGYGRLGRTVVDELRAAGEPVAVIEREPALVRELETTGVPVLSGDASDDEVLRAAGIERADALAVAVSSNAEAVYITLSARELNPKLNIVTRVGDPAHAVKARRAGATSVVNPHTMGGWRMAQGLLRPHASTFMDVATLANYEEIQLEEFEVTADSPFVGRSLDDLKLGSGYHVLVVAIRRADGRLVAVPGADERMLAGDVLIAFGAPPAIRALAKALGATP